LRRRARAAGNNLRLLMVLAFVGGVLWLGAQAGPLAQTAPAAPPAGDAPLPGFGKFRVVRIDAGGVFPREVRIERGVTVIWFNATAGYSSVVFNEGDSLRRSTRAPTLFFLAPDGTYVSAAFGPGGTASAAFVRPGTFNYFVTGLPLAEGSAFARVVVE